MAQARPFLVSLLACPALVLTGALVQHAAPSAALDQPTRPAAADARALELLDQALARLAPGRVQWLETTVWQRTEYDELSYQAEGRFLAAPGQRRRLRLRVTVGRSHGTMDVVSDGRRLRLCTRVGEGAPTVCDSALPGRPAPCEAALQRQGVGGVVGLLALIRGRLQGARREVVLWGGREVVRITGEWPGGPGSLPEGVPASAAPRRCRVYLDARTLWPRRLEWWGTEPAGGDVLLTEVEFRAPVLNRPLPPERCAREFTFGPG